MRLLLLTFGLLLLALPAGAQASAPDGRGRPADTADPYGFHLQSLLLFVNENAGRAVITVERTNTREDAQIRYITVGLTAEAPYDYAPQKGEIDFRAGQAAGTFTVPIVDHGVAGLPKTIQIALFGPSPIGLAFPARAILTILNNDPVGMVAASNPLGLPSASTGANPLAGARFYVDRRSEAARAARRYPAIAAIADRPGTARFGSFSYPNAEISVSRYLARASVLQPGTVPMLTTYRIVDGHCGHWVDPARDVSAYESFAQGLARGIGSYRAVLFLEQDSLITVGCLSRHGLAVRMAELNYAIDTLKAQCPHLVIYLDAGAADAVPARPMAALLRRAGVAKIQGFFLDATHFDFTRREIGYGQRISRLTGAKHFVVSTGESGRGPLRPRNRVKHGNEVLCNPNGRGLGPRPTASTGFARVDAFAWLDNPGGSSGRCVPGAPPAGAYWPAYALMLIRNADYRVR